MYKPYTPNSDLEEPPISGLHRTPVEDEEASDSGTETSYSSESGDSQMDGLALWQTAARTSVLLQPPQRSSLLPIGDMVTESTEANETKTGMFNTKLKFEEAKQTNLIMVNSLDRDQSVYPLPTQMRVKLPRVYKNVERIDIVQVKFFCGIYTISAARGNNYILLNVGTVATIPDGTYLLSQLLIAIQKALTDAGVVDCKVTFNPVTGRMTILSSANFNLLFKSGIRSVYNQTAYSEWGLGWNLGWGGQPTDLTGSSSYTSDHFPRLMEDYIYLLMNETEHMNAIDHTDVEKTGRTQDSTGQVSHYFGKLLLNYFGCWAQTFVESPKTFKPVLGRLDRLDFTWANRHGIALTGADVASCDWHMSLRITEIVEVPTADSSITQSRDRPQAS
jgi:hypothetical protein